MTTAAGRTDWYEVRTPAGRVSRHRKRNRAAVRAQREDGPAVVTQGETVVWDSMRDPAPPLSEAKPTDLTGYYPPKGVR